MKIENPAAFSFILQDEIYLLNNDKAFYNTPAATPVIEETKPVSFNYLGGHKKKFLIVVYYPGLEFIADNHLVPLESILKRMELSLDDVSIFNIANNPGTTFDQLANFFTPQKLLLLGESALPADMERLSLNKPGQLNNCKTLFSFSFDEMMDNSENKKAFWEQMKQL